MRLPSVDEYIEKKERDFKGDGMSINSLKDYKSDKNALTYYQTSLEKPILLKDINKDFITRFSIFIQKKREIDGKNMVDGGYQPLKND